MLALLLKAGLGALIGPLIGALVGAISSWWGRQQAAKSQAQKDTITVQGIALKDAQTRAEINRQVALSGDSNAEVITVPTGPATIVPKPDDTQTVVPSPTRNILVDNPATDIVRDQWDRD
jgi:hypothetical protein